MEGDDFNRVSSTPGHSRRKKWNQASWAVTAKEEKLRSGEAKTPTISCNLAAESNICRAVQLTQKNLDYVFPLRYQDLVKTRQDAFITSLVSIKPVARRQARSDEPRKRGFTTEYNIPLPETAKKVKVCAASFCSILGVGVFIDRPRRQVL